jgi:NADH-quinone oxidoreductase subunit M
MPVLAISFLAMGLACTGFPGTLGFVGQELLVDGAVDVFPVMGFAVVIASALTGLAVLRMYFSLFCGRSEVRLHPSLRLGLRPREAWTFVALVAVLVGLGIAPRPLVDSRFDASDEILRQRQEQRGDVSTPRAAGEHRADGTRVATLVREEIRTRTSAPAE